MRKRKGSLAVSMFLVVCLFALGLMPGASLTVNAQSTQSTQQGGYTQPRYVYTQPRRNPEAGKKKAAKRIGIGTAIGLGAGGLMGGGRGALVGGALGAGGGTLFHYHKKRKYEKRHYH
jgi:outer membrane lipoprotein SlyB